MPLRTNGNSRLVRLVEGQRVRTQLTIEIAFRFDYGSILRWVTRFNDNSIRAEAGANMVVLRLMRCSKPRGSQVFSHVALINTLRFLVSPKNLEPA